MNATRLHKKADMQFQADEVRRSMNTYGGAYYFVEISNKFCVHKSVFVGDPDLGRSHLRELTELRGKPAFHAYVNDLSARRRQAIANYFGQQVDEWCNHA